MVALHCSVQHLTVLEAMQLAARLKVARARQREALVPALLHTLGLAQSVNTVKQNSRANISIPGRSCEATRTAALSGGERKRLALGLELLSNPAVLYCDEVTSGLDSAGCSSTVALLARLARLGRTVVCTIHQPSAR